MVQLFKVITTSPTNLQFGYVNITTDTQLSTQVSFHIPRVGRFGHTDQQWWVIANGSPKTFNFKMEGNYSDQHLISLVLYTCYSISHVCLSPNMAGASPITWPLTSCENTLMDRMPTWRGELFLTVAMCGAQCFWSTIVSGSTDS